MDSRAQCKQAPRALSLHANRGLTRPPLRQATHRNNPLLQSMISTSNNATATRSGTNKDQYHLATTLPSIHFIAPILRAGVADPSPQVIPTHSPSYYSQRKGAESVVTSFRVCVDVSDLPTALHKYIFGGCSYLAFLSILW